MSPPESIRLSRSVVGEAEMTAVRRILEIGYLGMGPEVGRFEGDLQKFLGTKRDVVCVNTGTAALHLALQACGIGAGDEVLVPTTTYIASFQAISATGATPVPIEVMAGHCGIDPSDAERRISAATKAIMPVHYAGGFGELEAIYHLARRKGLRVIEDAAHAFGGTYQGLPCGATGDVVCFSFDGIKNITSGEGGAVVSADKAVIQAVQDARLLGVEKDTEKRLENLRSWDFDVRAQGWRYHMSDLMAAIGRVQLKRFSEFERQRVTLALQYEAGFAELATIRTLGLNYGQIIPHIYVIFVGGGQRDALRQTLNEQNIGCGIHYPPNHLLSFYSGQPGDFPVAERLHEEMLTLPLHPLVSDEEQKRIIAIIHNFAKSI